MPLDANGIWQYTESETAAPFSAVLNRLAQSVSDVVEPHVHDSGWTPIPIALPSPWTGSAMARRVGHLIEWKGNILPNATNWGAINNPQTLIDLTVDPDFAEFIPVETRLRILGSNVPSSAGDIFRTTFQSSGLVVARSNVTNSTRGITLDSLFPAN